MGMSINGKIGMGIVLILVLSLVAILALGSAFVFYEDSKPIEENFIYEKKITISRPTIETDLEINGAPFEHSYEYTDSNKIHTEMNEWPNNNQQCKCNESNIRSKIISNLSPGPAGRDGKNGASGLSGMPGPQGERGLPGRRGHKGTLGRSGEPGPEGLLGPKGEPGATGEKGDRGTQGPSGPPGIPGWSFNRDTPLKPNWRNRFGSQFPDSIYDSDHENSLVETVSSIGGSTGLPGRQGEIGPRGRMGPPGLKGERGYEGKKGSKGDQGFIGKKGDVGDKGPIGSSGVDGLPGSPGLDGISGTKGQKGDRGLIGRGKMGRTGIPGHKGSQFYSPEEVKQMVLSAVEIFVNAKSSNKEDLEIAAKRIIYNSPKGERGLPGKSGLPGFKGEEGPPGSYGPIGPQGLPGPRGNTGNRGEEGHSGERGMKGDPGSPGPVCYANGTVVVIKGEMGSQGETGSRGLPGNPGTPAYNNFAIRRETSNEIEYGGMKGEKGDPGPPGLPGINFGSMGMPPRYVRGGVFGLMAKPRPRPGQDGNIEKQNDTDIYFHPAEASPGERGLPGPPGIRGMPGSEGPVGPPGPPGPPGPFAPVRRTEPVNTFKKYNYKTPYEFSLHAGRRGMSNGEESSFEFGMAPSTTLSFTTRESLIQAWYLHNSGTLAYVLDDDTIFMRSPNGWRELTMGYTLAPQLRKEHTIHSKPEIPHVEIASESVKKSSLQWEDESRAKVGPLRLAALNDPISGDVRSVSSVDFACNRQARSAGLRGVFRALFSAPRHEVASLVRSVDRNIPIVNLKGEIALNSWASIVDGGEFANGPQILSFDGKNVLTDDRWPLKLFWHGSTRYGEQSAGNNCNNWSSGQTSSIGMASELNNTMIFGQRKVSCNNYLALLCIQHARLIPK